MPARCLLPLLAVFLATPSAAQFQLVRDVNPVGADGFSAFYIRDGDWPRDDTRAAQFLVYNGEAYFTANDGTAGFELWRTNGTPEGTVRVSDFAPGDGSAFGITSRPAVRYDGRYWITATTGPSEAVIASLEGVDGPTAVYRRIAGNASVVQAVPEMRSLVFNETGEGASAAVCEYTRDTDGDDLPDADYACTYDAFAPVTAGRVVWLDGSGDGAGFGYFLDGTGVWRTGLTKPSTERVGLSQQARDEFGYAVSGTGSGLHRLGSRIYFACNFWDRRSVVEYGSELCVSRGDFDDVALAEDLVEGERGSQPFILGTVGDAFYVVARTEVDDRYPFGLYRGTPDAAGNLSVRLVTEAPRDFSISPTYDSVSLFSLGGKTYFIADSQVAQFTRRRHLFDAETGALVEDLGGDGQIVGGVAVDGRYAYFFGQPSGRSSDPYTLYRFDGTVSEAVGQLPDAAFGSALTPYNGGLLVHAQVDGGDGVYGLGLDVRTVRRRLAAEGALAFAVEYDGAALPLTIETSSLGGAGDVVVTILDTEGEPVSDVPEGASALRRYYRVAVSDSVASVEAALRLSYTDADVAEAGVADEAALEVWRRDGAGWAPLAVASRDAESNTLTTAPVTRLSDLLITGPRGATTSSDSGPTMPPALRVAPNPVHGPASVSVSLSLAAPVRLSVVDALGREVAVLHDGAVAAGDHVFSLRSTSWSSGLYVVRLVAGGTAVTRSLVVAR